MNEIVKNRNRGNQNYSNTDKDDGKKDDTVQIENLHVVTTTTTTVKGATRTAAGVESAKDMLLVKMTT